MRSSSWYSNCLRALRQAYSGSAMKSPLPKAFQLPTVISRLKKNNVFQQREATYNIKLYYSLLQSNQNNQNCRCCNQRQQIQLLIAANEGNIINPIQKSINFMKESFDRLENDDHMIRSLKQEKEHTEKQMENLFTYLSGQDQYTDQLKFFGDKYRQRIQQFQNLKIENEELKKQISDIKMSQDFRNPKIFESQDNNRISMDRGNCDSWSKMVTSNETSIDPMRSKLDQIQKMKNAATQMAKKQNQQYDQLIAQIYKLFEKISTIRRLQSQVMQGQQRDGQQDTVTVPKKLYQRLVQVYSLKMAEICGKEFYIHKAKKQKATQQNSSNLQEQLKDRIRSNYSDFIEPFKEPKYDISSFFRRLAEKFSFGSEWETYHKNNTEEAINFKGKIDEILSQDRSKIDLQANEEIKDESKVSEPLLDQSFRNKISQLVNLLNFTIEQKEHWDKLNQNIKKDSLFNMTKLVQIVSSAYNKSNDQLIGNIEKLTQSIFKHFFDQLNKLLSERLKDTSQIFQKTNKPLKQHILKQNLGKQISALAKGQIWKSADRYAKQKLYNMFSLVREYVIFASSNQIYSSIKNRK